MKLVLGVTGPDISKQYVVDSRADTWITVGRGKDCAIYLVGADRTVSRQHLRLRCDGDSMVVEVISASSGVESSLGHIGPGQSSPLGPGEYVKLGAYRLDVSSFDEARHASAELPGASTAAVPRTPTPAMPRGELGDLFAPPPQQDAWFGTGARLDARDKGVPEDPFAGWGNPQPPTIVNEGPGPGQRRSRGAEDDLLGPPRGGAGRQGRGTSFDDIASGGRGDDLPSSGGEFSTFLKGPSPQDRHVAPDHVQPIDMPWPQPPQRPAMPLPPNEPRPAQRRVEPTLGADSAFGSGWDFDPPAPSPTLPPSPGLGTGQTPARPDLDKTKILDQRQLASTAEVFSEEGWVPKGQEDSVFNSSPKPLPRTADTATPKANTSATWAAFARGLDLPATPTLDEAAAERVGKIIRELVIGLTSMLQARQGWKREMRIIDRTQLGSTGNNPLKMLSAEECLNEIFLQRKGYMPLDDAVSQSIEDLQLHQVAAAEATRQAIIGTLTYFDPDRIEREHSRPRLGMFAALDKARLWDHFRALHASYAGDEAEWLDRVFRDHYVRAYEQRSSEP